MNTNSTLHSKGVSMTRHLLLVVYVILGIFMLPVLVQAQSTSGQQCFIGTNNPTAVQARSTWTINQAANTVTIRTTLSRTFVDNTYGTNTVGWPGSHTFSNLTGSDYLQIALLDNTNTKRLEFKMDYMSSSSSAPSGFRSLGVTGGDGNMIFGSTSNVLNVVTSLDANFNQFGYVLTTNSPATNSSYAPNPTYPNWIFDVWYEVTVNLSVFGPSGFGKPNITGVHASPSKTGNNSEPVTTLSSCCALFTPTVSGNNTVCNGSNAQLTVNNAAGSTYLWSTGATTASITVSPSTTTTYTVTVTSSDGCVVTLNRTVSISCVTFDGIQCFIGTNNPTAVQAQSTWTINQAANTVTIRTTLSKTFVDNTYGTNKIGWPGSHTFSNLTGSDYLQIALLDNTNTKRLEFKMDYMSSSSSAPSGFRSLGVTGGDGNMIFGSTSNVLNVVTSLDANFNQFGYVLTTNSPATNSNYDPNPTYPNWIFDVWYEVTVNLSVFGPSGFGKPNITGVHASPSKTGNNSEPVSPTCCNLPANPISGTTTICSGTGTTLTASGGGTYLWSTGATTASITVSPTATTTYNVTVTSTGNCTSSTGVTVTVQSCVDCTNITPGTIAANQTICPGGDSAPFSNVSSATTSFSGGVKYQWYRFVGASAPTNISSATLIPGATASTYDPPAGSVTAKTWFVRGAAVNSAACTTFNSFSNWVCVDVGPIPAVPVCSPTVSNVCPATTVNLLSLVPATPNTPGGTFEWRTGTSPTSALVPNQTSVGAGTYYLFEKSSAGCYSQPLAVTVTINTCVQPSLTINNVTVNENAGIATLQICSSVASTTPITVTYTTSNGTATAGTDYLTISANATIPAGQTCVNVSIPIVDDNIPEPTETFNVTLTNPVGATIAIPVGIVTILDNDVALPSLVINDVTVNENAGVATLQVCASASSTSPIVFTYTTSNGTAIAGTDYTAVSTTANIPAGQTCVNISIPIIDDILPEPTENFTVNLSNPTNATIADPQGVVTILDNDSPLPSLVINDITVNENVGNAVLQICASAVVTSPVTVTYTTQNGTALAGGDYTATTATANIPVGQTCVNISIPIIDDLLPEITENFTVNLSNPQAATIADPLGVVTILDNDTPIPALTINDITVNENAGFATLQICASAASAQPVTVTFTTSNGSAVAGADYTPTTNTATIPAGQTCVNINIPIVDDLTPEPTETFNVNLSNPVNATILDPLGIVTILDNDVPPPSLVINDVTVNENAGTATLQICASATALLPITVTYTTANGSAIAGSDYTATTTTATIPVGQTCVNINIPIIDDNIQEPTETFSVNLSNPNNATIADPQGVVTILDNDIPPPCLTSIQITGIACNNNGTPSNPNDDTYTFVLTVFGAGTGSNWVGSYSNPALGVFQFAPTPYNTPVPLGPFPAGPFTGGPAVPPLFFPNGLDISISVQDATNPSCPSNTVVTSPGPCSNVLPSLTINDVTVNENAGTATLQICASAVSGSPITVNYSTLNANAVAGSDYTFTNATATIPVGQTCVNVSFPIIDDTTPE
ncbi:MAG TPA: Calx-beta domain-containing protein, partial [Chitinophagales bacterium]|nr:Calx-beta domain-containing protein [Chitinophagales bacterium]